MLEEPRYHSVSTVMEWDLAVMFCLPVFHRAVEAISVASVMDVTFPSSAAVMAFTGGDGQRMHSLHKCRGHGGSAAGLGSRESSHWFPLTGCWALRAALSPWRNLSRCIYIIIYMIFYIIIYISYIISSVSFVSSTVLGIPVWGRQNPGVLAKGKVFAAAPPPPLPPAGNPAAHPPVKLQQ